jgi:hypothetical protein
MFAPLVGRAIGSLIAGKNEYKQVLKNFSYELLREESSERKKLWLAKQVPFREFGEQIITICQFNLPDLLEFKKQSHSNGKDRGNSIPFWKVRTDGGYLKFCGTK